MCLASDVTSFVPSLAAALDAVCVKGSRIPSQADAGEGRGRELQSLGKGELTYGAAITGIT